MLVYLLENATFTSASLEQIDKKNHLIHLCLLDFQSLPAVSGRLGISDRLVDECLNNRSSKLDSYDGYDFITLNLPMTIAQDYKPKRIGIYFRLDLLVFVSDRIDFINDIVVTSQTEGIKIQSLGKFFHLFFDKITIDDREVLVSIEEEITSLEEEFIVSIKDDLVDYLVTFRKRLLNLKQYYEQLVEISEAIEENENNLIDKKELRYFKILTNRVNRLFTNVLNLRDYGTQVREAYQAQLDINLNKVMKIFTVVTSIFLPLTLIVGWYGMNIMMPEFHWEYGYPFVIVLCVVVVMGTLLYFKKNKWF
ncbi:CorA family divalent cation transporter [Acetobacterium carbinolicum]|jgi:magnesium transporter|uniref:magnesium transporter CorA family protein n=1 Tax=Acetobacterium TaxID=33951 RepID=UPI000DBEAB35|nr:MULTISPECIES: CorA family divalent cation transporter [unclassified Acetobacterium]AWW26614.1 magnesium transporter [Acetobacterium sp. KB-1]MDZ5725277.1 CorA family divalent cation transporter [Acetobacterium sp. K1/6]